MTEERDLRIEATLSAFRERDAFGRILPSPAWLDLSPIDRDEAHERQLRSRRLEAEIDSRGLSTTGRAVLERARGMGQLR